MDKQYKQTLLLVAAMVWLTACTKNSGEPEIPGQLPQEIIMETSGVVTRSSSPLAEGATFGVLGYKCPDGTFDPDRSLPDLLYNARVEKYISEGLPGYRYIPTAHWPASGKGMFGAYTPHSSSVEPGAITVSPSTLPGLPRITIEMGHEKGRIDFATASIGPIGRIYNGGDPADSIARSSNYVNFRFYRRMAYVSFRCKAVNMPADTRLFINRLTIKNVYRKGTYRMDSNQWTDRASLDATSGATLNLTSVGSPIDTLMFKDLVNPEGDVQIIAMIPQTYDNVELTISYNLEYLKPAGGVQYNITGVKRIPLSVDWKQGTQHIYDIEFSFNEAFGENVLFNFNVQEWNKLDTIKTSM